MSKLYPEPSEEQLQDIRNLIDVGKTLAGNYYYLSR